MSRVSRPSRTSRAGRTSRPGLAARLCRVLVGRHPRRWRQRYADEMLDVLEQHRAGARTVLDLVFSTMDAHLDREWRDWSWLRRMARSAVP